MFVVIEDCRPLDAIGPFDSYDEADAWRNRQDETQAGRLRYTITELILPENSYEGNPSRRHWLDAQHPWGGYTKAKQTEYLAASERAMAQW